jgi:hypothetical protein
VDALPRRLGLSVNTLQKQGLAAYMPRNVPAGNCQHIETFPRHPSQAAMNFKLTAAASALGGKAGKKRKSRPTLSARLLRRLQSQWAAASAFFAAVLASLAAAATVASNELPVLLGGL